MASPGGVEPLLADLFRFVRLLSLLLRLPDAPNLVQQFIKSLARDTQGLHVGANKGMTEIVLHFNDDGPCQVRAGHHQVIAFDAGINTAE